MRLGLAGACAAAYLAIATPAGAQAQQRIDGIAAVVNDFVYTDTLVRAVRDLRLVDASARASDAAAARALVERHLVFEDAVRFAASEPTAAAVAERKQQWMATLPAGFDLQSALQRLDLPEAELQDWFRADVQIEVYLNRLFSASAQPTASEIANYVRDHGATLATGTDRSPEAIEAAARAQLARDNRQMRIRDWIEGLKRRADITIRIK